MSCLLVGLFCADARIPTLLKADGPRLLLRGPMFQVPTVWAPNLDANTYQSYTIYQIGPIEQTPPE